MGCCPSTPYDPTPPAYDRSPPMPPHDDVKETVKEILTETQPTPLPSKSRAFDPTDLVKDRSFRQLKQLASDKHSEPRVPSSPLPLPTEDWASKIWRRSESFVSTTDDNSFSSTLLRTQASKNDGRRSNGSHSPAKKPDARNQSPGSLTTMARRNVRRPQDQSPGRRGPTRVVGGPKADLGERSGRRSRSPARRVGRTESGRRTDPSPGRSRRLNPKGGELIENPLVSLECFIFL